MSAGPMPGDAPQSYVIEQAILGALLQDAAAFELVQPMTPAHFRDAENSDIYRAIALPTPTADLIEVFERLRSAGKADQCGGLTGLNALAQGVPSAANAGKHAQWLRDESAKRDALALLDRLKLDLVTAPDSGEAIRHARDALGDLTRPVNTPQPVDIFRAIVAPVLDPEDFPQLLREYARPLAAAAGHDQSAYLMAGLAAAAAATHDGLRLLIDPRTSWFESARLWVLLLGAPGSAKTPAIRAAMSPVFELHRNLREQYTRDNAGLGKDDPRPSQPALYTNDPTVEALSDVLVANPRGVVAVFEELDSWLGSHDAYRGGQGSKDRGEWLRLFDGGPHQVDRVKRGSVLVENWGASILGATTPAGLKRHAKNLPPDGLIQRFLPVIVHPMVAPDNSIDFEGIKPQRERFEAMLCELCTAPPGIVKLSPAAAAVFYERRDALRAEVEAVASMSEPMAGHVAKHAGLIARVALAFHALEYGKHSTDEHIDVQTMQRAVRLLRKLTRHALAMFDTLAGGSDSALSLARSMARSILAGRFEGVTRRDLINKCRQFRDAEDGPREAALRFLADAAWLTPLDAGRQYAGRAAGFAVNPAVHARFAAEGDALQARRAAVREMLGG